MADLPSWIVAVITAIYPGFTPAPPYVYDGYIEGDYVYAAAAASGRIDQIAVTEGQDVAAGALLFALEDDQAKASLRSAEAQLAQLRPSWKTCPPDRARPKPRSSAPLCGKPAWPMTLPKPGWTAPRRCWPKARPR
ncbi:MAG: biotin/lipoyl-binding protein [Alphaproteobacteria bacterium]|nr:biotin/lipoyl-binding protein [Alphaproteobacteria bacterium]